MNTSTISVIPFENPPSFSSVLHQYRTKVIDNRSKNSYTDEDIIAGLKARDRMVIKYVYKQYFLMTKFMITSNSGNKMDAEDLFQDALVVIYQKISTGNLNLTCSFKTFFYSICRNLWLQKLNKRKINYEFKEVAETNEWQDDHSMEDIIEESEKYKLFQQHFLRLKTDEQKVLKLYMDKIPLKDIANLMGYKSENYAKLRKYICKEKLKNAILNDPQYRKIYQFDSLSPVINW